MEYFLSIYFDLKFGLSTQNQNHLGQGREPHWVDPSFKLLSGAVLVESEPFS